MHTNGNAPEMPIENHLTVERIAPVLGQLQLQIIQLEAAVEARDRIILELRARLEHSEEVKTA